ncbi:MAG: IS200/IS605 family transposase [Muribaculaceae bacterium]|nr:IS200/IS605 family transposase [Muribaculaceae bacterium]
MSHTSLSYHLVFVTYAREKVILPEHERELYSFIYSIATSQGVTIRCIGGMQDHIHILCDIKPTLSVSQIVKIIKSESSKFMRINPNFRFWRGWGEGYGAFTVSPSARDKVINYILNQKMHHAGISFEMEYTDMLSSAGLES